MICADFWQGKTVLVTAGAGFLASWLIRKLVSYGANVVAVVRRVKPDSHFALVGLHRHVTVEQGSIYDADFITGLFDRHHFDVCFHVAYGADVNKVLTEPLECFRSTVESTWLLLELIRTRNPKCICVVSSSDKAYGAQTLPYRESNALMPRHPYEVAKASQDHAAQSYGKVYNVPVAVTRCGNYFGPYDFNFSRLIPGVVKDIISGNAPELRSDGRFTRDFLYIEDAVDVQLLMAEQLARNPSLYGEAFNFSYGEQIEVIEIVNRIVAILDAQVEPKVNNTVQAEIRHMHLSSNKAAQKLNWTPRVGFDDGLQSTVLWYADFLRNKLAAEKTDDHIASLDLKRNKHVQSSINGTQRRIRGA